MARREQTTMYLDTTIMDIIRRRAKRRKTSLGEAIREVVAAGLDALMIEERRVKAQNEAMG